MRVLVFSDEILCGLSNLSMQRYEIVLAVGIRWEGVMADLCVRVGELVALLMRSQHVSFSIVMLRRRTGS